MFDRLFSLPPSDLVLRTRWYIYIRWFLILAVAVPGLLSVYWGEGLSNQLRRDALLGLIAIISNVLFFGLSRLFSSNKYYRALATSLLIADTLVITYLIFIKGGIESRSPILYVIPILMSSAIFGRRVIYRTALVAVFAYSSLMILDYHDEIRSIGAVNPQLRDDLPYLVNTLTFFASVLLIIAAIADFLTRTLIEKQIQASASAAALQRTQTIAKIGSWELDLASGNMQVSDELLRIFGIKKGSFDFETFLKRVHPRDRPTLRRHLANARDQLTPFSFDHQLLMPDRTSRFIHTEAQIIKDRKGRAVKVIGTDQDITSEKALDTAKDEFVSLASHQLRTPATGVRTYLSMVMEGYAGKLSPQVRSYLGQAFKANERQLHVIDGLLSVASIESGKLVLDKARTDLSVLINSALAESETAFQNRKQTIEIDQPARPIVAEIDPHRFRMILDNLLSNASKYTPEGGHILVRLFRQKNTAFISVSDNGIGIPKKEVSKLFIKFSRLHNTSGTDVEGSGLGLYLAKYLIGLHGGKITVDSRPGHGSTFTIKLPLIQSRSSKVKHPTLHTGSRLRRFASNRRIGNHRPGATH